MDIKKEFRKYMEESPSLRSEGTYEQYSRNISQFLRWYQETNDLEFVRLNRPNILEYRSYVKNILNLKHSTINQKLSALLSFNHFLIYKEIQEDIVINKLDYLQVNRSKVNPAKTEKKDVTRTRQKILNDSKSDNRLRNYAAITLLATTGMRVSECCDALFSDLDIYNRELQIKSGKNDKPRIVYLPDIAIDALKEYFKVKDNIYKGACASGDQHIFVGRQTGKNKKHYGLTRQTFNNILNKYGMNDNLTPHELRHNWASWAVTPEIDGGGGFSIEAVAAILGHSSTRTTSIYTNPSVKQMKDKVNKY